MILRSPNPCIHLLLTALLIVQIGCKEKPGNEEIVPVAAQQDNAVNSYLYSYADSLPLKAALAAFQLEPGLQIELLAAEPLVADPAAFAFDETGALFVAENTGYPDPVDSEGKETEGKIARLEDRDGDGKFDYRTDFVTGLSYPNGILPWKGGVFVTCAPHLYYFKDTNGNGKADIRKIVLTGFDDSKTAQIRVSHPSLGLDGWIYLTSGLTGGAVQAPDRPDRKPVVFTASDSRFHPETLEFELTAGRSQFGLAFDAFGRRFGSSNRHPLQHLVLEPWHLERNPHLPFSNTIQNVSPVESEALVFPISRSVTTADYIPRLMGRSHQGTFTSACGTLVYQGGGLSASHVGNVFICEPAQNLVQRQRLQKKGASFESERVHEGWEFLASSDTWFNPVFLGHGPNGALYLADMYRKTIDHPAYVPEETRPMLDFSSGKHKGRIYRIRNNEPKTSVNSFIFPKKDPVSLSETLEALEDEDAWSRETAFRLLLEARPTESVSALQELAANAPLPETRVRALWLVYHMSGIRPELLHAALQDPHPGIREQALWLAQSENLFSQAEAQIFQRAEDTDPRVRFVTALVLGAREEASKLAPLAQIAQRDAEDPWLRTAVLAGLNNQALEFLQVLRKSIGPRSSPGLRELFSDLGELIGTSLPVDTSKSLMTSIREEEATLEEIALLAGLCEGLEGNDAHFQHLDQLGLTENRLEAWKTQLTQLLHAASTEEGDRIRAVRILGYFPPGKTESLLGSLLRPEQPFAVQLEAVAALARHNHSTAGKLLTRAEQWKTFTPQVKAAVIHRLMSQPVLLEELIRALETGAIPPTDIPSTSRQRLMKSTNPRVQAAAVSLFDFLEEGGRMEVYNRYKEVLTWKGDGLAGKVVFQIQCAICHRHSGEGAEVGPDLTGIGNQPASAILLHTLVPNYEILPEYQTTTVETNDGRQVSGRILSESAHSIRLKTSFGTEETLLRSRIKRMESPGTSLMPDGLEQNMSQQDLADLLAFLKGSSAPG
jgi:putative membrane-bound dehydrogenase-like protein